MKPEELLYAESHEWVHVADVDGRKVGTIGITAFAVHQLTDLVHMVLPKVGAKVSAGKEFGEVESVKAVSSLYSPVDGEVIEVNAPLVGKLETLSTDPYTAGWMIKVALSGAVPAGKLMDLAAYEKQCAAEG
ncbi:glycine cleavage system H protein [Pirellula staleyi DSM 6068]|uniref:Glycine cleavage system H protein n=1 Tax=Pirellula staleyi (strain ATCC 27377 / DSM 6068 / ICPB 4128) TaxID=530564 RepID=D2R7Y3_PIRSD|nr:glycine cleavage system protein GcvH [Pirellula staleyi]ADB19314.1 glycine cleavage system H protein [Pirellula staleyi DSM 6068]